VKTLKVRASQLLGAPYRIPLSHYIQPQEGSSNCASALRAEHPLARPSLGIVVMPGDSSFISLRSSGNARLRATARSACRLIIKSDRLADLQNSRQPEVFYRSVVLLSIRVQEATSKADGYGVGPVICLELVDDVPDMQIDRSFQKFLSMGRSVGSDCRLGRLQTHLHYVFPSFRLYWSGMPGRSIIVEMTSP
jgi:hypothetical protein